jgi:hypothetical protein
VRRAAPTGDRVSDFSLLANGQLDASRDMIC